MRYKNGAPVKLYVVVDQEDGDVSATIRMTTARAWKISDEAFSGHKYKIVTYVQEEK